MAGMYLARLVCSDVECAEEVSAETATLRELQTLVCECGCALEVVGWPDVAAEPLARVVLLRVRQASAARRGGGGELPDAA
jgi:hypothetical protein